MQGGLWDEQASLWGAVPQPRRTEPLGPGACVLRARLRDQAEGWLRDVAQLLRAAPLRHMRTAGGHRISVAMSNCGPLGWTSDLQGYAYTATDPQTGQPWPAMPEHWRVMARDAAAEAGFPGFRPDACLINRYRAGARMGLHQDRDEQAPEAPIVSVSLGWPAVFLWGGAKRQDRAERVALLEGDVVVWGGPSRWNYHGIAPLPEGPGTLRAGDPDVSACRINLTFRQVRP